ncbi:hypothetical protein K1719_034751 [Acacia pycnantha]|nr:hypothetical protein K1719_034751 [Acacia pycnantha]
MEKAELRSSSTLAKIIGTVVSIYGALVVVLFRGPTLKSASSPSTLDSSSAQKKWVLGGFLLFVEYLVVPIWYILQGLLCTGLCCLIEIWALHLKGPLYVSMFRPLSVAVAAAMGVIFLGEALHLGRHEIRSLSLSLSLHYHFSPFKSRKPESGRSYKEDSCMLRSSCDTC